MTATATAEFTVETTETGWAHICHVTCGKWASFLNPTRERSAWYMSIHRCGPHNSEWHTSATPTDEDHRSESPGSVAGWFRSVSRYVTSQPRAVLLDPEVWPAVEELAHTLTARFPELSRSTGDDLVPAPPESTGGRTGPASIAVGRTP